MFSTTLLSSDLIEVISASTEDIMLLITLRHSACTAIYLMRFLIRNFTVFHILFMPGVNTLARLG